MPTPNQTDGQTPACPPTFLAGFLECALWSSCDEDGSPLDDNFGTEDFRPEDLAKLEAECADFLSYDNVQVLIDQSGMTMEQAGHDFWLTKNGHGAGFWDRGLGKLGTELTRHAKTFGTTDLYVGDDGQLHAS